MKNKKLLSVLACVAVASIGAPQIMQVVKLLGVGAAVQKFGPQMNSAINKLAYQRDTPANATKVVPILSGGINSRKAIGAAQVMGRRADIDKVKAVVQLDQDLFGEVKVRAMIPVSSEKDLSHVTRVEGVGISGIVDLRL